MVDLTDAAVWHRLGLVDADLADISMSKTAAAGGAVEWLGYEKGANLVIFPNRMEERDGRLDRVDSEIILDPDG